MIIVSRSEFEELVDRAMVQLPKDYLEKIKNVAIIVEDLPSLEQRRKLELRNDQTLLGLYEGTPLSERQGLGKTLPDKITLFKKPLEYQSNNITELFNNIAKTIWHEVAHYFGLDHEMIYKLENKES